MKKIALVGSATSWQLCPQDDPDLEIRSVGIMWKRLKKLDRYYQIHILGRYREQAADWIEWAKQNSERIILQEPQADMPGAVIFPKQAIIDHFQTQYFTSSIAWMIAHALYEQQSHLAELRLSLYGCNMAADDEYANQRPCVEHWLGLAKGAGVTVYVSDGSELMKSRGLYGYETNGHFAHVIQTNIVKEEATKFTEELKRQQANDMGFQCCGILKALERVKSELNGQCPEWVEPEIERVNAALAQARNDLNQAERNIYTIEGGLTWLNWAKNNWS